MINVLLSNGYPLDIIFSTINNRIKMLSRKKNVYVNDTINNNDSNDNNNIKKYFTIPYINEISEKFKTIVEKNNFKVRYKPMNTLNSVIKLDKDKLEKMEQCDVVYKISCLDCDSSYAGQTKRKVKTRIKEHMANIRKLKDSRTVISEHQLEYGHKFNWENIQILDTEPFFHKRLTSEMIFIKKQINGINKQNDIEQLSEAYFSLLNITSPT
ncbi:hypothetical protein ALC57_00353 [Trachymyrmex cornetzi]|uniref:GIY-YIG domain-containing protein n=1 Tax=Trachymyrmex cornetzi TaxID=471704 RepID=A0A151JS85_9HYME|nr:hypothetical protein ALC57_00353 [Trachymyrmex cornetzi]